MKPLFVLGAAIVGGILLLITEEKEPPAKTGLPLPEKDRDLDDKSRTPMDLDAEVTRLRRELRHAERDRKKQRTKVEHPL